jgi:hypothetical protein
MPKKHSFRRPRRWLLRRPGVVAKPPPEVHAMMAKDRNRGSSARRCDPAAAATAFDIRGNRNARSWPSPTHLAVSGTCAAPRNDRCAGWRYSLRGTGIPNVAEARTGTRRVGGWLPCAALTNAWRQLGKNIHFIPALRRHSSLAVTAPRTERATVRPAPRQRAWPRLRWC